MACKCTDNKCDTDKTLVSIIIDEEESLMIERYNFEYNGLLMLLRQFTSDSPFKVDDERYEQVLEEYLRAFAAYNICFNELIHKYLGEDLNILRDSDPNIDTTENCILFYTDNNKIIEKYNKMEE